LLSVQADMVTVPGTEGYMGVMAGQARWSRPARRMIDVNTDGKDDRYSIRGGFAESAPPRSRPAEEACR